MSVFYMGFSLGDDLVEMKEDLVLKLNDERRESRSNVTIENSDINGFDFDTEFDFWPIQHPTEPSREDRPVECPMPHSSRLSNDDDMMQEDRFLECKIPEGSIVHYQENGARETTEPTIRAVRKRHHDHADTITPLLQTLPVYHHSFHNTNNTTIFNKCQQVHKFES
ncbi:uncharacterized protein [Rutidosis leptorrhynchoides]|uniref:uncharacterized protein n=1 Tax=Rutidosis leptorrhynchoides TaxID=125765 RepID=UPI003A995BAD